MNPQNGGARFPQVEDVREAGAALEEGAEGEEGAGGAAERGAALWAGFRADAAGSEDCALVVALCVARYGREVAEASTAGGEHSIN